MVNILTPALEKLLKEDHAGLKPKGDEKCTALITDLSFKERAY